MTIQSALPIGISIVALLLPGILKSDGWPAWVNGLISGGIIAIFAGLSVWAGGNFSPDVLADWALFVAAYSALLAGPLKPLDSYLMSALNLPFLKPAPANANPIRIPTGMTLPPGSSPVPPRASGQPPTTPGTSA